jgi:hypothetical protein
MGFYGKGLHTNTFTGCSLQVGGSEKLQDISEKYFVVDTMLLLLWQHFHLG